MESLALRYRPQTFDDLAGQQVVQTLLHTMVASRQVPQAMLFSGSRGTGKTTTARIVAASLNCEGTPTPCGHCVSCKSTFDGTSLDVLEIDAASNGLVDNIRDLRQQVLYATGGAYRVVILDEAQSMSAAAFNALLKTLEEPPPATVFILCTTEPGKILPTVVSRCMPFTFQRLTVADIVARLSHIAAAEHIEAEPAMLTLIAQRVDGAMRDAVIALDQMNRAAIRTAEAFTALHGHTDPGADLLAAIITGRHTDAYQELRELRATTDTTTLISGLISVLADVLVLNGGGSIPANPARSTLAARLGTAPAVACMQLLWDLRTKARLGDDGLDIAVALLTDKFATTTATTAAPATKVSLNQMRTLSR